LTPACADLLEPKGSGLELLKSTFNAENFICRLSWSISSHYAAARNREKITKTPYFGGSRSFKVIHVDISKKLVASACCDKQHVCAYPQSFSR